MSPKSASEGYSTLVREPGCSHLDSSTLTYNVLLSSRSTLSSLKAESTHLVPRLVSFTSIHHATLTHPLSHCSPKLALGRGCGHQSQHVRLPVLMEYGVRVLSGWSWSLGRPLRLFFSVFFVCPSLLAADTELWAEMDVQDYVNRKWLWLKVDTQETVRNKWNLLKWVYGFRDVRYEIRLMCIKVNWCNQNPIRFKGKILLLTT